MPRTPPTPRRAERVAAWLITGPLGHLAAGLADVAELVLRRLRR